MFKVDRTGFGNTSTVIGCIGADLASRENNAEGASGMVKAILGVYTLLEKETFSSYLKLIAASGGQVGHRKLIVEHSLKQAEGRCIAGGFCH